MDITKAIKLRDEMQALLDESENLIAELRADEAAGVYLHETDARLVRLTELSKEPGGLVWRAKQKMERMKRGS